MMQVNEITSAHDLPALCREINQSSWDDANEMSEYDPESLRRYLETQDTLFVVCFETIGDTRTLLGIASSRFEIKPYDGELWLYVDELDVCANHRRKGAGKFIMEYLIDLAKTRGCEEVWLGAEADNDAANALYHSLDPDDVSEVVGYTYETDE